MGRRVHGELLSWGKIRCFSGLIACQDARCRHPFGSCDRQLSPASLRLASRARRPPFRRCRVGARQASTADPQSRPQACAQSARRGSYHRRFVHPFHAPARVLRSAIVLKPSTLLHLHNLLRTRKYRMLFSPKRGHRPGPNGPKKELIDAVVEMKRRNPRVENHCACADCRFEGAVVRSDSRGFGVAGSFLQCAFVWIVW